MRLYWLLIFKDLFFQKKFSILFIINLSIGLIGFICLDTFQVNLKQSLNLKSKSILGADIGISSRNPLNSEHYKAAKDILGDIPKSNIVETYSMISNLSGEARLFQIKAIEMNFPFYGSIKLQKQGNKSSQEPILDIFNDHKIWVYPEVLSQLGAHVGDTLKIGNTQFVISDVVIDDSAAGFFTNMAPRVYMDLHKLNETGLVSNMSRAWYSQVYKKALNEKQLKVHIESLFKQSALNESVRVYSHKSASEQTARLLNYLTDYLSLVALCAIFLACIGASFLFKNYMNSKIYEIAICRSIGFSANTVIYLNLFRLVILGALAAITSCGISVFSLPFLTDFLDNFIFIDVLPQLRWQAVCSAFSLAIFGSLLIGLPSLLELKNLSPRQLFSSIFTRKKTVLASATIYFIFILSLWFLSVWQANSWITGSLFVASLLFTTLLLSGVAYTFLFLSSKFLECFPLYLKIALRNLYRQPTTTMTAFIALGLGVLLINLIPQIEHSISNEISVPERSKLPSLFLFDIQDEQLSELTTTLNQSSVKLESVSPMIRGRLRKINGKDFEKANANQKKFSREAQKEARFRNRGFNLSYRKNISESEKILKGRDFSGVYQERQDSPAELSVEVRFANRLGIQLGDILEFEVMEIPIIAKVINLRSVKWTSFQPNFFLQFQPGLLDEAPKTYVASIIQLDKDKKLNIQNQLVKLFPNVSIVDVTRVVKKLIGISNQMSKALQAMAILSFFVGLMVLISIISHQIENRKKDMNLLKTLGAPPGLFKKIFLSENLCLAFFSAIFSILISTGFSYLVIGYLFDFSWSWNWRLPIISIFTLMTLVFLITMIGLRTIQNKKVSLNP